MRRYQRIVLWWSIGLSVALPGWGAPPDTVQTGRYTIVAVGPEPAQADPLAALLTATLPQDIATVGDALVYLLQHSGYRLQTVDAAPAALALYALPLPAVHRRWGPIPLREALSVLAGEAYTLTIDRMSRTVSFTPREPSPPRRPRHGH